MKKIKSEISGPEVNYLGRKLGDLANRKKYERNEPRLKITKPEQTSVLCQKWKYNKKICCQKWTPYKPIALLYKLNHLVYNAGLDVESATSQLQYNQQQAGDSAVTSDCEIEIL